MKKFVFTVLFVLLTVGFVACRQERNDADTARLVRLDSLLALQPEVVLDSLKLIKTNELNRYNKAYHQLLDIIAKDKTYFNFTSDSLINTTVDELADYRSHQPQNYARSLMYQGIVRYRIQITDSTSYQPLKEAYSIFQSLSHPDLRTQYLCLYYLGEIHDENSNIKLGKQYVNEAVNIAKQLNDTSYLYACYRDLFWNAMKQSNYKRAGYYIDTLSKYVISQDDYLISFKNIQSTYCQYTNQHVKAIELERQIIQINKRSQFENTFISDYYCLSTSFGELNQSDSALKYAALTIEAIQDTCFRLNYLYYLNLGEIAEKAGKWTLSSNAYKKSYELLNSSIEKNMDSKIFELEKKYDLAEAENKILHFKTRAIILSAVALFMLFIIVLLLQHSRRQKQIKTLTEQRNMALENEKNLIEERQQILILENNRSEQELVKKQLIISFFKEISKQNLAIKNFLYDLKINNYIVNNLALYNRISEEYNNYNQKTKINSSDLLSDEVLIKLTGIPNEDIVKLNKSEQLILLLITLNVSNKEIALLLNTSSDSIRNRKLKLKKKIEHFQIHFEWQSSDLI